MSAAPEIALVGDDLMFASRLQSALGGSGITVTLASGGDVPSTGTVFVDLNRTPERGLDAIRRLHSERPAATIVGFCHHGKKELRRQAMASGATQVVTNGALGEVARRLAQLS